MKMSRKYLFLCIFLLPLQGCSFSVRILGRVFDKETGLPLAGTTINLLDGSDIKQTDSVGFFHVFSTTGPFQDPSFLVTKNGYKPFQLRIEDKSDETRFIVKTESIFVDYEEPVYPDPKNQGTYITGTSIEKWSKEFRTGDTLSIYLVRDDTKAEVERIKKQLKNIK